MSDNPVPNEDLASPLSKESLNPGSGTDGIGSAFSGLKENRSCVSKKIYSVGTLQYTARSLMVLFVWMLWGDFCFVLFESLFSGFMPLYMKQLHAPDTLISALTASAGGVVTLMFLPHLSMWSDRYRSRWGRRIPFLLWAAPCTVATMCLIGFVPEIANWISARIPLPSFISQTTFILTFLSIFTLAFHFFNMILWNVFTFLQRDVIPLETMPWALSCFRFVGTIGSLLFNWLIFPHMLDHRKEVCIGVGVLYAAAYLMMCLKVKEGEYPPSPPAKRSNLMETYMGYFKTCLSVRLYRIYFIVFMVSVIGNTGTKYFVTLFYQEQMKMSLQEIATLLNWSTGLSLAVLMLAGYLCRKFSPVRVFLGTMVCQIVIYFLSYFLVVDKPTVLIFTLLNIVPIVISQIAFNSTNMILFPKERFGQFSSGLNVFAMGCTIVASLMVGRLMDFSGHNYRLHYIMSGIGYLLALGPMILVYRGWLNHGGDQNYVPPEAD